MNYYWVLEGKLALSPMPSSRDLEGLRRTFDAVVVLTEEHELNYDLRALGELNFEVFWLPTPDFYKPQLLELYHAVRWIEEKLSSGKRVLVHCYGGLGRSGLVVSAYLTYAFNLGWREALKRVRRRRPGAVQDVSQLDALETFEQLIRALPEPALSAVDSIAEKYDYGWGIKHASKVTELSLKLARPPTLHLSGSELKVLAAACILHDIGAKLDAKEHHVKTVELLSKHEDELLKFFSRDEVELLKWTAYYHRGKTGSPLSDSVVPERLKSTLLKLSAVIRAADGLDYANTQVIDRVSLEKIGEKYVLVFSLSRPIPLDEERIAEKISLLALALGGEVELVRE